jgi:glycosyltransferase involved in cell wall biosynthesis
VRKLRVALLCHLPGGFDPVLDALSDAGVRERKGYLTIEGLWMKELPLHPDLEVEVVSFSKHVFRPQVLNVGNPSVRVHVLPAYPGTGMPTGWRVRHWMLERYLPHLHPAIVHGHRTLTGYGLLAAQSRFPSILTVNEIIADVIQSTGETFSLKAGRAMEARTLGRARDVIAVSEHLKRRMAALCKGRIHVIPNMVDRVYFDLARRESTPRILNVGRICPEKGTLDLIRVAVQLGQEGLRFTLDIVGGSSGAAGPQYIEQCKVLASGPKGAVEIKFHGWLDPTEIAKLQSVATVAVFASTAPYETFCLGVAEALASGVPAIVYRHGPLPEHIEEGVNGFVCSPDDSAELAASIRMLISDPEKARRMGANARKLAARYHPKAVIAKTLAAYECVLSASNPRPKTVPLSSF